MTAYTHPAYYRSYRTSAWQFGGAAAARLRESDRTPDGAPRVA